MLLGIYSSKRDKHGNCYYAVALGKYGVPTIAGTIGAPNINTRELDKLGIYYVETELSIREFNRFVKDLPHFGCTWDEIKTHLGLLGSGPTFLANTAKGEK